MNWLQSIFILVLGLATACNNQDQVFKKLSSSSTGITFENHLEEDDQYNVYNFMNFYTGAGVAAGDINNDGLTDLYFSGNMVTGRLFLNKGGLRFEDITATAGIENQQWGTGCSMIDINNDGWIDIYVSVSGDGNYQQTANLLYINNGDNTFSEQAEAFGINDSRQTQHAAFFDYDKDGDLDLFLIINPAAYEQKVNVVDPRKTNGEAISTDVLYRNNGDGSFTDVSHEAGILIEGYSLGVGISDINLDGWPDIYISNDFVGNDVLYVNQGDGTFIDQAAQYFQHTSYAGMGNDIADFNNDGLMDVMVLDMRPEDNRRQKLIISSTSYDLFELMLESGYMPQYSRNTLQMNRGDGLFSEIGFLAGVSSTDWSWSALFADYDNDGDKDLFVTNGFLRDLGNLDYIHYQNIYDNPMGEPETKVKNKLATIKALEGADIGDYLFENTGQLKFEKRSKSWGIKDKGYSNGAVYADLDNDGDLELIVNNINENAHVYENLSNTKSEHNYLRLKLNGPAQNLQGLGARIYLYQADRTQVWEHFLSRGYESSVDPNPHFGLGNLPIDSLIVHWPDGKTQTIRNVTPNQLLEINYQQATSDGVMNRSNTPSTLFQSPESQPVPYVHKENKQVDFKTQPILPHMHAQLGPGAAVADVNLDTKDDLYVGGARGQPGTLFIQQQDSTFISTVFQQDSLYEDMGALFFDVEGDGDQDLYVVSGGTSHPLGSQYYRDRLYINDGQGNLDRYQTAFTEPISGSCVVGGDFDRDGDLDLFIGGRVIPGSYPLAPKSTLLRNDTPKNGAPKFTDITESIMGMTDLGMVTAALWTDFNDDTWLDLIVVGEFMPIKMFVNHQGTLDLAQPAGVEHSEGWWNSITGGDFDQDGDTDYLIGNLGLNTKYQASKEEPLCIYASDYDKNGRIDPVLCYYLDGKNHIAHTRDEIIRQISAMRARFRTYEEYAEVEFDQSFLPSELEAAYVVHANRFESSYLRNEGDGSFVLLELPIEAQIAPVYGMVTGDFDQNGTLDALLTGNSYSTEVSTGRYDASFGLVLSMEDGVWKNLKLSESGFQNKGDAKALVKFQSNQRNWVLVTNNNDQARSFFSSLPKGVISPDASDQFAHLYYADGTQRKIEFYHGAGYLSQSTRFYEVDQRVTKLVITDNQGQSRELSINAN